MPSTDRYTRETQTSQVIYPDGRVKTQALSQIVTRLRSRVWDSAKGDKLNPTPYENTIHEYSRTGKRVYDHGNRIEVVSPYPDITPLPLLEPEFGFLNGIRNSSLEKFYERQRGGDNPDLGTGFAEMYSSRGTMGKELGSLLQVARKSAFPGTKVIGSAWLAWQYGWKPTIDDIWKTANSNLFPNGKGAVLKTYGRSSRAGSRRVSLTSNGHTVVSAQSFSARYQIVARYEVSNPNLLALQKVTTLNPANIAWNLMPFSFVADWIVDVGGYLALMEASLGLGLVFRSGYETDTRLYRSVDTISGKNSFYSDSVSGTRTYKYLRRLPLGGFPRPHAPSVSTDLGSGRCLNAAALLTNLLR